MTLVTVPLGFLLFLSFIVIMVMIAFIFVIYESKKEITFLKQYNANLITRHRTLISEYNLIIENKDNTEVNMVGIPKDLLKKIISLCHPDKHDNSKTSTEVTRVLIKLNN